MSFRVQVEASQAELDGEDGFPSADILGTLQVLSDSDPEAWYIGVADYASQLRRENPPLAAGVREDPDAEGARGDKAALVPIELQTVLRMSSTSTRTF